MAWPGPGPNTPENRKQMLGRLENPSCFNRRNARAMTATYMLLGRKYIISYPTVRQTPSTHASSFSGRSLSICCTSLQCHAAVARKCDNETNQPPVGLQSRPMWPVAAVRSVEGSVWATNGLCPHSRSFCSKPTVLLKSAECRLCSLQIAQKAPSNGLRSVVQPPIPNSSSCWASLPCALICSLGLIRASAVLYQYRLHTALPPTFTPPFCSQA
ncbi:uncharacterized protein K444DRAFT_175533 [Hyaloscypha bicolor E]|jgi:hypothetical protein|uniref:Uncharacterized protein n=1 Tax=Hyaloscypha bicolor E TaxID=1095630 RepID=A0A2J6TQG5_9HELO|nr:uncharacterized protein K444DRAFT_175533 [Hyaloscypha bicolor E]PMD65259.1 hypothetical protein K444DRAFT_175533 [Hyaloscypha bicolor E]